MPLAELEGIVLNVLLLGFAAYIFFIIYDLAKKSNAGRFGTFVLFFALGLGLGAFMLKTVVVEMIGGA